MLFSLHLRAHKPYSIATHGSKENVIIIGSSLENVCYDRLAHRLHARTRSADPGARQTAEPSTSNATSIAQYAALEAVREAWTRAADAREYCETQKAHRRRAPRDSRHHVRVAGGAFYAFPNISAHLSNRAGKPALAKSCTEIIKMLWRKCKSRSFGRSVRRTRYLRLSYATSHERIEEGLRASSVFFRSR